ncbi:MAG: ribonuclease P protein subunit [Candidatus Aenigmatarchaeota archaeon]
MRTVRNILRHELIGLECKVINSKNKFQIGISGKIIDETLKTILIDASGTRKRIPKKDSVFRVHVGEKNVDVSGDHIITRPEDRIKKPFRRW